MSSKSITPKDILPDGIDSAEINGKSIRKGTVAAFLANAEIFQDTETTDEQKHVALLTMQELAPDVIAIGLHKHVVFKNLRIEQILVDAE